MRHPDISPSRRSPSRRAPRAASRRHEAKPASGAIRCRRKFLRIFPGGFEDADYLALERDYKAAAHRRWHSILDEVTFRALLRKGEYEEIARRAVAVEARTNLIFSFEKMALRDAMKGDGGAKAFAKGLYAFLHGEDDPPARFAAWCDVVAGLPRRQTRVSTWPIVTVFGFLAQPERHFFLKPNVTKRAAKEYGYDFHYESRPGWPAYASLLEFTRIVRADLKDLRPRDMIDIQSFLWVQGSDEYAE